MALRTNQSSDHEIYPVIIKGYGSWDSVSDAGIFANIISIGNVR